MAKRTLVTDVYVDGERYAAGTAESDLPGGVEISNPKAWSDYQGTDGALAGGPVVDPTTGGAPPPKAGRGSSKEAWADYAESKGVDVHPGSTKEEIISALEDAGVPTE